MSWADITEAAEKKSALGLLKRDKQFSKAWSIINNDKPGSLQ